VGDAVAGAGRGLRRAYDEAASAVERTPDPERAVAKAAELVKAADQIVGDAARLRARMALRLQQSEGLSLAELAKRIGTSKSRADQLIRLARGESESVGRMPQTLAE
jgi:DNA-directed RNA polymerase specialized sigma24 family protein